MSNPIYSGIVGYSVYSALLLTLVNIYKILGVFNLPFVNVLLHFEGYNGSNVSSDSF